MKQEELLDKYYKGETSSEEEQFLKELFAADETDSAEKEMFAFYQHESFVPSDLEESIANALSKKIRKKKNLKIRLISFSSAAALIAIVFSLYMNFRAEKKAKMEYSFFVMEQALTQVSESIQPQAKEEMYVLWVDNDVEIIIN